MPHQSSSSYIKIYKNISPTNGVVRWITWKIITILMINSWWKSLLEWHGDPGTYISIPIIRVVFKVKAKRSYWMRPYSPGGERVPWGSGGSAGEAVIMPTLHLKSLSRDRKSRECRWERRHTKKTDFHQNRLSNQMGTIQELGPRGWAGTVIGQISTETRHNIVLLSTVC